MYTKVKQTELYNYYVTESLTITVALDHHVQYTLLNRTFAIGHKMQQRHSRLFDRPCNYSAWLTRPYLIGCKNGCRQLSASRSLVGSVLPRDIDSRADRNGCCLVIAQYELTLFVVRKRAIKKLRFRQKTRFLSTTLFLNFKNREALLCLPWCYIFLKKYCRSLPFVAKKL